MKTNKIIVLGIVVFAFSLAVFFLHSTKILNAETSSVYRELQKFSDCLDIIQKNYVEDVPATKLIEGAIRGMTSVLDPHSSYLSREEYREMQISTTGTFGGLGIEIGLRDNILTVISPIEGTPAFEAGILPGDRVLKIGETSTTDMTLQEAVKLLRGPKGTKVTITISRETEEKPFEVTLTRAIIHIESAKFQMLEPGYGYIKVRNFQVDTAEAVQDALRDMGTLKGLILDLRYNPGGLLEQAIAVSDLFLSDGMIVYTDGKTPDDKTEYFAHAEGSFTGFSLVVLINGGSASAAEIVSGALQDNGRALVVGVRSFGKASVQTIRPLNDGSALKLTVARYYTPSGRSIQAKGIDPDIWIEQVVPAKDDPLTQTFIREKDLKLHLEPEEGDSTVSEVKTMLENDNQLKYGLDLLKSWEVFGRTIRDT
ncbi:MAG TPA: S41 family peptidase [Deltaproteobacteria bacterium]|nr:S41 family peptidase [Deltaproteobacteria bacterium]